MRRGLACVSLFVCAYVGWQVAAGARIHVTRDNANVRERPSLDAEVITMLGGAIEIVADSVGTGVDTGDTA